MKNLARVDKCMARRQDYRRADSLLMAQNPCWRLPVQVGTLLQRLQNCASALVFVRAVERYVACDERAVLMESKLDLSQGCIVLDDAGKLQMEARDALSEACRASKQTVDNGRQARDIAHLV